MELAFSKKFAKSYAEMPRLVQNAFDKQSQFLLQDIRHPSLRAKKYGGTTDIWQARVTNSWRFYFKIEGDVYWLVDVIFHPK